MWRGRLVLIAGAATACEAFGEGPTPDGVSDAGTTADAAGGGAGAGASWCATLSPAPFFCEDFSTGSLEGRWMPDLIRGGLASVVPRGPSPPSLTLGLADGGKCAGSHAYLTVARDLSEWRGGVRVRAKLNIDQPSGSPKDGALNGGPALDLAGAGGRCSFYVGWDDGVPSIKIDRHRDGQGREHVLHRIILLDAPVRSGDWIDATFELTGTERGTHVSWSVAGLKSGEDFVSQCVWSKPDRLLIATNCSTGAFELGVDDVAFWMTDE